IDAGGFGIRLADGLLGLPIRLRAYAVQLALLLAANLCAGGLAFRAETRRNPPALRNHPLIDPLLDLTHIVDTLDAHIDEFDAEIGQVLAPPLDHQGGEGLASQALLWAHVPRRGWRRGVRLPGSRRPLFLWGPSLLQRLHRQLAGKRADGLDQQVATDDIARGGIKQVVEATLGRGLVAHRL